MKRFWKKFFGFVNDYVMTCFVVLMVFVAAVVTIIIANNAKADEKPPKIANKITVDGITYKGDVYSDGVIYAIYADNTLTFVGEGAIDNTDRWVGVEKNLVKTVVIKNGITSIGNYEFSGGNSHDGFINLRVVIIEGALINHIGNNAFWDNYNLEKVVIKGQVKDYGTDIFYGCSALEETEGVPNGMLRGTPLYEKPEISIIAPPSDSKKDPQTWAPETDRSAPNQDPFQAL